MKAVFLNTHQQTIKTRIVSRSKARMASDDIGIVPIFNTSVVNLDAVENSDLIIKVYQIHSDSIAHHTVWLCRDSTSLSPSGRFPC